MMQVVVVPSIIYRGVIEIILPPCFMSFFQRNLVHYDILRGTAVCFGTVGKDVEAALGSNIWYRCDLSSLDKAPSCCPPATDD